MGTFLAAFLTSPLALQIQRATVLDELRDLMADLMLQCQMWAG